MFKEDLRLDFIHELAVGKMVGKIDMLYFVFFVKRFLIRTYLFKLNKEKTFIQQAFYCLSIFCFFM